MGSGPNPGVGGWFLDYGGMEHDDQTVDVICPPHIEDDPTQPSALGLDFSRKEENNFDNASRKRNRVSFCARPGTKACREKMRRDKLNVRFVELSLIVDPGRPVKADKIAILSDATRNLNQLCLEAQQLKESNESLQDKIKILKAEKLELRDEKVRLKAEKEQIEQMLKAMSIPSFVAHPAPAPFHPPSYVTCNKNGLYATYQPMTMWQWIPPAARDTSQDHVLRPPVA